MEKFKIVDAMPQVGQFIALIPVPKYKSNTQNYFCATYKWEGDVLYVCNDVDLVEDIEGDEEAWKECFVEGVKHYLRNAKFVVY